MHFWQVRRLYLPIIFVIKGLIVRSWWQPIPYVAAVSGGLVKASGLCSAGLGWAGLVAANWFRFSWDTGEARWPLWPVTISSCRGSTVSSPGLSLTPPPWTGPSTWSPRAWGSSAGSCWPPPTTSRSRRSAAGSWTTIRWTDKQIRTFSFGARAFESCVNYIYYDIFKQLDIAGHGWAVPDPSDAQPHQQQQRGGQLQRAAGPRQVGRRGYRRLQDGQLHQRDPGAHPQVSHDDDDVMMMMMIMLIFSAIFIILLISAILTCSRRRKEAQVIISRLYLLEYYVFQSIMFDHVC